MAETALTVGNVTIVALTDGGGDFPLPLSRLFPSVPSEAWEPYRQRYPEVFGGPETWRNHYGCYLLRSQGRTILIDTGIGPGPVRVLGGVQGRLLEELRATGVAPEEIDTVFFTHLHLDHVGWNLTAEGKPTFPRARYLIHQADWEAFHRPEAEANLPEPYVARTITPLQSLGVLELLSGERALTAEVTAIPTPGHTPGHMSILVSSGGEKALITGDVLLHPAQVSEPEWCIAFDMDAEEAVRTRRRILDRLEAEGLTVVACHFPEPGYGRIVRLEGRRYWQAL